MPNTVEHDLPGQRFLVRLPDGQGELAYRRPLPHLLDLFHTEVSPQLRGQGIASDLVAAAMAYARAQGDRILPTCPYVRRWLERHPEAQELVGSAPPRSMS